MGFEDELRDAIKMTKKRKKDQISIWVPRMLVNSLQWISVGYCSALYFAGKKVGKEIISKEVKGSSMKDILKEIKEIFKKFGIGEIEVVEITDKKCILHLKECYACFHIQHMGRPICFFESGLIAGIIEAKTKKNVVVTETMCGGLGDEMDEFLIKFT